MDWNMVFHSSDNPRRTVDTSRIDEWVSSGFIKATKRFIPMNKGRVALYVRTLWWLDNNPINVSDLFQNVNKDLTSNHIHISNTHETLLRSVVRRAHGGEEHQELSFIAACFLKDHGKKPLIDAGCNGRYVDVASDDWTAIIECGDTNAPPILQHLHWVGWTGKGCKWVGVIPFQDFTSSHLFMWTFERGEKWNDEKAQDYYFEIG